MIRSLLMGLVLLLGAPSLAHADSSFPIATKYLPVGIMATAQTYLGQATSVGLGVELSYVQYFGSKNTTLANDGVGIGPYLQVQMVSAGLHARGALGAQVNYFFGGLEAALAVEGTDGVRSTTFFADIAPFLSIGIVSLALRLAIPIAAVDRGTPYNFEVGGVLTVKFPTPLNGSLL